MDARRYEQAVAVIDSAERLVRESEAAVCGKSFTPKPRAGSRAKFCGKKCRMKAAADRQRGRAAEADRAAAAEICAQTVREGYEPLKWSNGDGQAEENREV